MPASSAERSAAPLQGILLLLLAALLGLALLSHADADPACGPLADWIADGLVGRLGPILAWGLWAVLPPVALLWIFGGRKRAALILAAELFPLAAIASIALSPLDPLHGEAGASALAWLRTILGPWGSWIAIAALGIVSVWIAWRFALPGVLRDGMAGAASRAAAAAEAKRAERRARPAPATAGVSAKEGRGRLDRRAARNEDPKMVPRPARGAPAKEEEEEDEARGDAAEESEAFPEPRIQARRPAPARRPALHPSEVGVRKLPDVTLLEDLDGTRGAVDREEILETSKLLVRTLKNFGVEGKVGEVHPGPIVTRYEFEPGTGIRVSQIVSRVDDLALALRAKRIRLVAPIPGKAAVGIEVPNRRQALISLKEILESEDWAQQQGHLPLILGRDIAGIPVFSDLDRMPHLLVAGTTGSGKSVCLNALLLSLLFRRTPEELRLLLVDPKRLELTPYDGIPSLLCPVVIEPKHVSRMLEWLCGEMDRRYRVLSRYAVRNIEGYRRRAAAGETKGKPSTVPDGEEMENLPYIVVVVDELADLMLSQGGEIEGSISRLAHMARAVGIHMILATQRPSVDVLTGVIKANFPARISFQVASRIDSRTILDAGGAEFLLGRGDMLFIPPGKGEAVRVHGAFCTEGDGERVAAFLREQPAADTLFTEEEAEGPADPAREDEMFGDALRLVVRERQASVSFLQRRLKVGYARAARLMDLLEAAGVVSPYDGSKARDVMVDQRYLEEFDAGREDARAV